MSRKGNTSLKLISVFVGFIVFIGIGFGLRFFLERKASEISQAPSAPAADVDFALCEAKIDTDRDNCFLELAVKRKDSALCGYAGAAKDKCLGQFIKKESPPIPIKPAPPIQPPAGLPPPVAVPPPPAKPMPPPPAPIPPAPASSISFSLGQEEVVFDYTTMRCATLDLPDVYAHATRNSQGELVLVSGNAPDNFWMFGSSFNSLKRNCTPVFVSGKKPIVTSFDPEEWVTAIWNDGSLIHAFVHNEYRESLNPNSTAAQCKANFGNGCVYDFISYAVSSDGGHSFTVPSSPAHLLSIPSWQWDPNMNGGKATGIVGYMEPSSPVKMADGYYYSIFYAIPASYISQSLRGTCVMRTNTVENPSSWKIWDGKAFNIPFVNPYLNPQANPAQYQCAPLNSLSNVRGSLTYNTYLGKYMAVGYRSGNTGAQCGFYFSLSSDLINWSSPQLLKQAYAGFSPCLPPGSVTEGRTTTSGGTPGYPEAYPSVIDHDSSDQLNFTTADNTFYIYFMRNMDQGGKFDRDLIRLPVTITKQ